MATPLIHLFLIILFFWCYCNWNYFCNFILIIHAYCIEIQLIFIYWFWASFVKFISKFFTLWHFMQNFLNFIFYYPLLVYIERYTFWGSFFFFFFGLRVAPAVYGGSQVRGWIGAIAAGLRYSHSNTGSLAPWGRSGIEPRKTSWFLVRFVSAVPQCKLQEIHFI